MKRKVSLIIFYTEDKKILMQDRRNIQKAYEEWGYFGGQIEEGETPEQAVIRETKEELDYDLTDFKFIGQCKTDIKEKDIVVERFLFVTPLGDKQKLFNQKEGQGMKLYTIEEAKQLKTFTGDRQALDIIEKFLNKNLHPQL